MKISDVMKMKSSTDVVTISPDATVTELLAVLSEHNIGAVIVSEGDGSVDGIVSERDVVRRLHDTDDVLSAPVSSIMTATVHCCAPDEDLDELRRSMTDHRIRHVPVVDEGRLVAVVSIGDVVKSHIDQVEFERDQLDSYLRQS